MEKTQSTILVWLENLFTKKPERLEEHVHQPVIDSEITQPSSVETELEESSTVCYCFDVNETTLLTAMKKHRLDSIEAVGLHLNAGTHCGSCHTKIQEMLDLEALKH